MAKSDKAVLNQIFCWDLLRILEKLGVSCKIAFPVAIFAQPSKTVCSAAKSDILSSQNIFLIFVDRKCFPKTGNGLYPALLVSNLAHMSKTVSHTAKSDKTHAYRNIFLLLSNENIFARMEVPSKSEFAVLLSCISRKLEITYGPKVFQNFNFRSRSHYMGTKHQHHCLFWWPQYFIAGNRELVY